MIRLIMQKEGCLVMIRMSMLRNVPVVFGERQVGIFQDACLDQTRKRVYAFVVACGMRGKRLVPAERVRMISEKFILIDGMEKYRHSNKQETSLFIRDMTGMLVGRVTDYAINKTSLDILAIEFLTGYGPKERRMRIWSYAYTFLQDCGEVAVPLDLRCQPCLFREENDACECLQ